ncbi:MAG: hypothetical protein H0V82_10715 [Candidatus Protochlamydia sp.]|nr:hypothetical protein [Candidatus Protochlamydia sp.]
MNKIKDSVYHFEYQAEPIQEDEQVLFEGITDEAVLKKKMNRITPSGFLSKTLMELFLEVSMDFHVMVVSMSTCFG